MVRHLAETDFYRYVTFHSVRITLVYIGMLRRAPDARGFVYWLDRMNQGTTLQTMIATIQKSASYRRRFPAAARSADAAPRLDGPAQTGPTTTPPTTQPAVTQPPVTQPPVTQPPQTVPLRPTTSRPATTTTGLPAGSTSTTLANGTGTSAVP